MTNSLKKDNYNSKFKLRNNILFFTVKIGFINKEVIMFGVGIVKSIKRSCCKLFVAGTSVPRHFPLICF